MLIVPLYVFGFIYLAILAFMLLFFIINIGHLFQTGSLTLTSFTVTVVLLALAVIIIFGTYVALRTTDWQQPITVFNIDWFRSANNF